MSDDWDRGQNVRHDQTQILRHRRNSSGKDEAESSGKDGGGGPPRGQFYLVLNEVGIETRVHIPLNKQGVSIGVSFSAFYFFFFPDNGLYINK